MLGWCPSASKTMGTGGQERSRVLCAQRLTDAFYAGNFREWSTITINNHPSNPQQPIHSLRFAPRRLVKTLAEKKSPLPVTTMTGDWWPIPIKMLMTWLWGGFTTSFQRISPENTDLTCKHNHIQIQISSNHPNWKRFRRYPRVNQLFDVENPHLKVDYFPRLSPGTWIYHRPFLFVKKWQIIRNLK